jgi:hypothetical protein
MSVLKQAFASGPFFKRYSFTFSYSLLLEVFNSLARNST